jgi:signal transduction histidine kinase
VTAGADAQAVVTRHAWDGGERGWALYYGIVLAGSIAVAQVTGTVPEWYRLGATAALLAMVPWYLLVGRRAIFGSPSDRIGVTYLIGLLPLLTVALLFVNSVAFIMAALCPQCFMAVSYRRAVAFVVALNVPQVVIALTLGASRTQLGVVGAIAVVSIAFSVAFAGWIGKIIDQSAERADLIEQLEMTRAELAAANREAGVLAERNRLASEIHDTIAQGFTSIVMLAQAAESVIETDPAVARRQLGLVTQTARENLAETRALVAGLTPAALASQTLADALARLAERAGQELGVQAGFEVEGTPRSLGTGAEVVLLRVCQEALANVRKHARAGTARVRLSYGERCVRLDIADDGLGFDPCQVSEGYGLRGMRARVAEIGGSLIVETAPGDGTTISAEVA